jgi:hypothetical protein
MSWFFKSSTLVRVPWGFALFKGDGLPVHVENKPGVQYPPLADCEKEIAASIA